jgi:ribosomal protein S18 acetylase RimI-like enzyme
MPPLTDRTTIRRLLDTDRPWSVYALGDLSPAQFAHCTWFSPSGEAPALALLYGGFAPPVLFALGEPTVLRAVVADIGDVPELYLHVRPEVVPLLQARYRVSDPKAMWRMILNPAKYNPPAPGSATPVGPADLGALRHLYADGELAGEQPGFFSPAMLGEGVYFGVWEGGDLIAAAGTHLVAEAESVAAVGNVYTRRNRRGRGLGARVTGAVVAELLRRQVGTVALNVSQDNAAAALVYEQLGFERYCAFVEGLAILR